MARVHITRTELSVMAELIQDELNRHNNLAQNVVQRLGRAQLQRLLNNEAPVVATPARPMQPAGSPRPTS